MLGRGEHAEVAELRERIRMLEADCDHYATLAKENAAARDNFKAAHAVEENLRREAENEAEQLRVQLAGCSVAALGGISPRSEVANMGDYGWSASYGDVVTLRTKYEKLSGYVRRLREALWKMLDGDYTGADTDQWRHVLLAEVNDV